MKPTETTPPRRRARPTFDPEAALPEDVRELLRAAPPAVQAATLGLTKRLGREFVPIRTAGTESPETGSEKTWRTREARGEVALVRMNGQCYVTIGDIVRVMLRGTTAPRRPEPSQACRDGYAAFRAGARAARQGA